MKNHVYIAILENTFDIDWFNKTRSMCIKSLTFTLELNL